VLETAQSEHQSCWTLEFSVIPERISARDCMEWEPLARSSQEDWIKPSAAIRTFRLDKQLEIERLRFQLTGLAREL
jgi:hypothetical protein